MPEAANDQDLLLKVIWHLNKYRQPLPSPVPNACAGLSINAPEARSSIPEESASTTEQVFLDRNAELNQIRQFVSDRDRRLLLLAGMRGMGKADLLRRAFVEIMPKWRKDRDYRNGGNAVRAPHRPTGK